MKTISRLARAIITLGAFVLPGSHLNAAETDAPFHVFIGAYTGPKNKGIQHARFDPATGTISSPELAFELNNPSFLAVHPDQRKIYAAGEVFKGGKSGVITALAVDPKTGRLDRLNQHPSEGSGPCHLSVDKTGRNVLVANYGSGSIACLPLDNDGKLSPATSFMQHAGSSVNPQRQKEPHAHWIEVDPSNRFALACDLGLDKVLVYQFDPRRGTLAPATPPHAATKPGAGPRHLAFHPGGRFAYVINELDSTVAAYAWNASTGGLSELQRHSTLPAGFTNNSSCAEIAVHPAGKFLYGSNRGHDSIAVFAIDESSGLMTAVQHESTQGKTPRFFAIDPTGRWLLACNQGSDSIVLFRIDPQTGRLTPTGRKTAVASPVCLVFVPAQ
jgi:6-phosphogluconolactonase